MSACFSLRNLQLGRDCRYGARSSSKIFFRRLDASTRRPLIHVLSSHSAPLSNLRIEIRRRFLFSGRASCSVCTKPMTWTTAEYRESEPACSTCFRAPKSDSTTFIHRMRFLMCAMSEWEAKDLLSHSCSAVVIDAVYHVRLARLFINSLQGSNSSSFRSRIPGLC
jgi:hypothetical protein